MKSLGYGLKPLKFDLESLKSGPKSMEPDSKLLKYLTPNLNFLKSGLKSLEYLKSFKSLKSLKYLKSDLKSLKL